MSYYVNISILKIKKDALLCTYKYSKIKKSTSDLNIYDKAYLICIYINI